MDSDIIVISFQLDTKNEGIKKLLIESIAQGIVITDHPTAENLRRSYPGSQKPEA
jgi:hypothetical protein